MYIVVKNSKYLKNTFKEYNKFVNKNTLSSLSVFLFIGIKKHSVFDGVSPYVSPVSVSVGLLFFHIPSY